MSKVYDKGGAKKNWDKGTRYFIFNYKGLAIEAQETVKRQIILQCYICGYKEYQGFQYLDSESQKPMILYPKCSCRNQIFKSL